MTAMFRLFFDVGATRWALRLRQFSVAGRDGATPARIAAFVRRYVRKQYPGRVVRVSGVRLVSDLWGGPPRGWEAGGNVEVGVVSTPPEAAPCRV